MKILKEVTPKEKRNEIVAAYLGGENSYEELGNYYNVAPKKIMVWVSRYRKSKKVVSLQRFDERQAMVGVSNDIMNYANGIQQFTVDDLPSEITAGIERNTLSWHLSNLCRQGKLRRIGRGIYTVNLLDRKSVV